MHELNSVDTTKETRLEWVEPEVRELDVRETAFRPEFGGDGEHRYTDCTHS